MVIWKISIRLYLLKNRLTRQRVLTNAVSHSLEELHIIKFSYISYYLVMFSTSNRTSHIWIIWGIFIGQYVKYCGFPLLYIIRRYAYRNVNEVKWYVFFIPCYLLVLNKHVINKVQKTNKHVNIIKIKMSTSNSMMK